jgi:hypothetical protein
MDEEAAAKAAFFIGSTPPEKGQPLPLTPFKIKCN